MAEGLPLAPKLRFWRLEAGLSQRELGLRADVAYATIAGIEAGRPAQPRTIKKLADALGVRPSDLIAQPTACYPS